MQTAHTLIDIPTSHTHRFQLRVQGHDAQHGGAAEVALQRQKFGPFWTTLDCRVREGFTKLSQPEQRQWQAAAERELTEEWFAQEIYELRQ